MNINDKREITTFENKIKNEYEKLCEDVKKLTKQKILDRAVEIGFKKALKEFMLSEEGLTMKEIKHLAYRDNILDKIWKHFETYDGMFTLESFFYDVIYGGMEID